MTVENSMPSNQKKDEADLGSETDQSYFGFRLGHHHFALPGFYVLEIIHPPSINPLPQSVEWVEGLFQMRGEIIPVYRLMAKESEEAESSQEAFHYCLILQDEKGKLAIQVHQADQLFTFKEKDWTPVFQDANSERADYYLIHEGKTYFYISTDRIRQPYSAKGVAI